MFFLTARRMLDEARRHLPALGALLDAAVAAPTTPRAVDRRELRRRPVDLDRSRHHGEGRAACAWSRARSAGTTSAAGPRCPRCARPTRAATSCIGGATLIDGDGNIVVADEGAPYVGVLGVRDLSSSPPSDAVLVIPKDRAQDVRRVVEAAKQSGRDSICCDAKEPQ